MSRFKQTSHVILSKWYNPSRKSNGELKKRRQSLLRKHIRQGDLKTHLVVNVADRSIMRALSTWSLRDFLCQFSVFVSNVKFTLYLKKAGLASRNIVHRRKTHSTLCRFLPLYSSFYLYMWSRLDHYIDPTYTSRITVPVACWYIL